MRFVYGKPAMVLGRSLVIADVHLGIEFELRKRKVSLPLQHKKTARALNKLMRDTGAQELIVLGDLKHDVYGFEAREKRMMREFLALLDCDRVLVVKGNHDSQLNELGETKTKLEVAPPTGIVLRFSGKRFGLAHGHAWPSPEVLKASFLLTAHIHPLVEFRESIGSWRKQAWLVGKLKRSKEFGTRPQKTIVFPAYGLLSGGIIVNREPLIGPLFENKLFDLANAEAIALSGTRLGKIKQLMIR